MQLADPARLQAGANADPEFRLAARYWSATLSLESPPRALRGVGSSPWDFASFASSLEGLRHACWTKGALGSAGWCRSPLDWRSIALCSHECAHGSPAAMWRH
jgi:hypothetical protein